MPGAWYPNERFQRLFLVKSGMPKPSSYQEAISQTVHVLNTVTVPMGLQIGTDSGSAEGENDRTHWGVIYDHLNRIVYWRSAMNQNLQRLRLQDAGLMVGEVEGRLLTESSKLPFFTDAARSISYGPEPGA